MRFYSPTPNHLSLFGPESREADLPAAAEALGGVGPQPVPAVVALVAAVRMPSQALALDDLQT